MSGAIYDRLKKIYEEEVVSFHMPGHKYGKIFERLGYESRVNDFLKFDTTEVYGTDDLHNPKDIIKKSQEKAREILFPDSNAQLNFLVNGTTSGIEAAILSCVGEGEKIILNRFCHKSAYNSCVLSKAIPVFVNEEIDYENSVLKGGDLSDYKKKIEENKEARAVFITRPTYYGMVFDVEEIIKLAHSYNMLVIVDEAHGSHFGLNEKLPDSSINYGADIVVLSIHKTLPSVTQSSVIVSQGDLVDKIKLKYYLNVFQSSSPSYIMMMSIELSLEIYKEYGKVLMDELINNIYRFKRRVKDFRIYETDDITKIFINTIDKGINGYDFAKILRHKYNIQVEMSNYCGILLLCSIGNRSEDFDKMREALKDISRKRIFGIDQDFFEYEFEKDVSQKNEDIKSLSNSRQISLRLPSVIPKMMITPSKAMSIKTENVGLDESLGKICGEFVIPYPPGVCLIGPGEVISLEIIDFIKNAKKSRVDINGMESDKFEYIKVLDID